VQWDTSANLNNSATTTVRYQNLVTCDAYAEATNIQQCSTTTSYYGASAGGSFPTSDTTLNRIISAQFGTNTATDNVTLDRLTLTLVRK
jgi:hypothetical protein